jgi:hypothetical protein
VLGNLKKWEKILWITWRSMLFSLVWAAITGSRHEYPSS